MGTVRSIVQVHLVQYGFEGLTSSRYDCGCQTSDLMPCEYDDISNCEPGFKVPCDPETCPADGECDWHIGPNKPAPGDKLKVEE